MDFVGALKKLLGGKQPQQKPKTDQPDITYNPTNKNIPFSTTIQQSQYQPHQQQVVTPTAHNTGGLNTGWDLQRPLGLGVYQQDGINQMPLQGVTPMIQPPRIQGNGFQVQPSWDDPNQLVYPHQLRVR